MILSGKEIARHIGEEIVITPFNPKRLNPNSYNLTLADELMVYDNYELDMKKKNTGQNRESVEKANTFPVLSI